VGLYNTMEKKTYISPAIKNETALDTESMIAASITGVGGDSGLQPGTGETPTTADSKESVDWDIWD